MHAIALWCPTNDGVLSNMSVELTQVATGVYEAELPNEPGVSRLQVAVTHDGIMSLFHTNIDPSLPPFLCYLPQPWGEFVYPNQIVVLSANGSEDVEDKVRMAFAKKWQGNKTAYHFAADEHKTADCAKSNDHEESKVHHEDKGAKDDEESDDDEMEDGATDEDTADDEDDTEDDEDGIDEDGIDEDGIDEDGIDANTKKALIADCICNDNVK